MIKEFQLLDYSHGAWRGSGKNAGINLNEVSTVKQSGTYAPDNSVLVKMNNGEELRVEALVRDFIVEEA